MPTLSDYFHFKEATLDLISESEIEAIVELINDAYSYQNEAKGEPRINKEKLRQRVASSQFYVVMNDSQVAGCVYTELARRYLHFGLLTVAPSLRGTGLGTAIMLAIEEYARDLNCEAIELDYMSLAPWLKPYYEKYGYAETGETTHWGTIDLIRMIKSLHE